MPITRKTMSAEPPKATKATVRTDDMSFLDHLEDLRRHLIRGFIGLGIGIVIAFIFSDFLLNHVLLGPTRADFIIYEWLGLDAVDLTLQSRKLPGQFFTYFGTMMLVGMILGSPIFFYQIWKFITPALSNEEAKGARGGAFFVSFFFFLGIAFGYCVLIPVALQFFASFSFSEQIRNDFDINEYFGSFTMWLIGSGVVFQLPVISYYLSRIGILTPTFLRNYQRHAVVICLLIAALITPPDPMSQLLLGVPMIALYQLSIQISKLAVKRRNKEIWGSNKAPE